MHSLLLWLACGPGPAATGTSSPGTSSSSPTPTVEPVPGTPDGAPVATVVDRRFECELLFGDTPGDPTDNRVQTRWNVGGSDLGVPVAIGDDLYLLFGDTVGWRGIWAPGEDPDAVARLPLAAVEADPTAVCRDLAFLVTDEVPSVAAGIDPSIERDFAGVAMVAPEGQAIDAYIGDGAGPYPFMPGTFEVPTGALSHDGVLYVFYAGRTEPGPPIRATLGYLARWDTPGVGLPIYSIVRPVDRLENGPLGGGFVQIAPVLHEGQIWMFGTGDYRRSGVRLARVAAANLESGRGTELFDPTAGAWVDAPGAVEPLFETTGVGELSITTAGGAWIAMYQRELRSDSGEIVDNRVVVRFAAAPEGPWSEAATVIDTADPAFRAEHCCGGEACPGAQILHCDRAGPYGVQLLPGIRVAGDGPWTFDLPFLASTWDPYGVVLFTTTVTVDPPG